MVHDRHARGLRTDVHDAAMLARQHQARGGLRAKKRTTRVRGHDAIPLPGGLIERGAGRAVACVVDEDAGDFAIKQKLEPPPSWLDDEHPLAHQYRMWGVLTLSELWLSGDAGLVLFCVGRAPDTVIEREKRG